MSHIRQQCRMSLYEWNARSALGCTDEPVAEIVPNTQPITPQQPKFFHSRELRRSFPLLRTCARQTSRRMSCNLHDFNGLARIKRVRIPSRCRAPKRGRRIRRHEPVPHPSRCSTAQDSYRMR
jgi:hypothetical protein